LSVEIGAVVSPVLRAKTASSTAALTPTSGSAAPRVTKSVDFTSTPAALAAAAKLPFAACAIVAAFVFASSTAFVRMTSSFTLSRTSSSFGTADGLISTTVIQA
jgi:hypothetical protein